MEQCIDFRINYYSWLTKPEIGMTHNEAMVYCVICDFVRNGLPAHPTYAQLADVLGSEDKSHCPWVSRNAVEGLVKKGFIARPVRGNSHGRANEYELIRTPRELFEIVDRKRPGYFSDRMREEYAKELDLNIDNDIAYPMEVDSYTPPAKPAKDKEQETAFDDAAFLDDCNLSEEQPVENEKQVATTEVETVTAITPEGEEIEVPAVQPEEDEEESENESEQQHDQRENKQPEQVSTRINVSEMDPQQKAYFTKQESTEWDDSGIPF